MARSVSFPLIAYGVLAALFVGLNAMRGPEPRPEGPWISFHRDPQQTLGGLVPQGLWAPDHAELKRRVQSLTGVRLGRELGNSLRLAAGQDPEWVFEGKGGQTLFLTGELWVSRGTDPRIDNELRRIAGVIGDYQRQLAQEGWTLVVLPVPTKLGVHRERAQWPADGSNLLNSNPVPADRSDEVYGGFIAALRAQGVASVDLQTVYRQVVAKDPAINLYPPSDSHWSGEGIQLAARETSRAIASVAPIRAREVVRPTYHQEAYVGDLVKAFDPLPGFTTRLSPLWMYPERLLNGEVGTGYPAVTRPSGLVVALGTSYTGHYTWIPAPVGFAWQLGLHLGNVEVQNRPLAGQGSFKSFEAFWANRDEIAREFADRAGADKPRVVLWEMPIRDIPGIGNSTLSWTQKNGWY